MTLRAKVEQQLEWRVRHPLRTWRERAAPKLAERLYRAADVVAFVPFADEVVDLPPPREVNGVRLDVIGDLAAFTELPRAEVEELVRRRRTLSFRAEWYATPAALRRDAWFYRSSKSYLFGNAAHVLPDNWIERFVHRHAVDGPICEFGGGTGNLATHLVALGHEVTLTELNALQRDFVRFRTRTHGLDGRLHVLDAGEPLPRDAFAAMVALDVFEHVPDLRALLDASILPALAPDGVLVENSPFVANAANPMHHADPGLDDHLRGAGLTIMDEGEDRTRVWGRQSQ